VLRRSWPKFGSRELVRLDRPTAGRALVKGRPCHELRGWLHEVGALLDKDAYHPPGNVLRPTCGASPELTSSAIGQSARCWRRTGVASCL
jgi:hypothetical protein